MTKKFTPIKKNDLVKEFKDVLLNGDIIRYDGYHTCIEVLPHSLMGKVASSDNLFQHTGSLYSYYKDNTIEKKTIELSGKALWDAIKEMENEYVVAKISCEGSGCCQYATWAIYLQ